MEDEEEGEEGEEGGVWYIQGRDGERER